MNSDNKLKEVDIKNQKCYYLGKVIDSNNLNLDNILVDKKWYENILIYSVAYITLYGARPLNIIFDKVDRNIENMAVQDIQLFHADEKNEKFFDRKQF